VAATWLCLRLHHRSLTPHARVCRGVQNVTTSVLSGTLSTELIRTIRNKLPSLTANIQSNIATLNKELSDLGEDIPSGRGAMVHAIIELCNKVQEQYKYIINHVRRHSALHQSHLARHSGHTSSTSS
jgi:Dynamin central region